MDDAVDRLGNRSEAGERLLIDAAWTQFESLAAIRKAHSTDTWPSFDVPGYRVLQEIHRGGQGVVYQAMHESTRRKVAIKFLKEGPFADPTELARFDREVDVLSRLNHPHIVAIHDRGSTAGHAYYVMDYIPGRPLDAYVASSALSTREVLGLCRKVCEAVNVAHLRGVIHRDLKPSNIRIDDEGEPHVLDFGLAKLSRDSSSSADSMTMTGQFLGSLPWASPEQAEGRSDLLDVRTDVYSLGVILFQAITGRFPYDVFGPVRSVMDNILLASPLRPSVLCSSANDDVDTIVLRCLSKDRDRRYQSAGELARDLERCLSGEPIDAKRDSMGYVLRKHLRRNRGLVAAVLGFACLLTAGSVTSLTLWYRAEQALAEKEMQRERADREASQTQAVADFQSQMLAEIDPHSMGVKLQADLLTKARAAAKRSGRNTEEIDVRAAELEKLMAGIDLTGLALTALDESVFQRSLSAIEKQFGDQLLVKAKLLQTVADTLLEVGLLDAAVVPQTEALAIRRQELGDEHADTLFSIAHMGLLLRDRGNLAEAEPYYREALEKRRLALGDEHLDTLSSIHNMGGLLQARGKLKEAEPYYREAFEKRRRILGEEHIDTLTSMSSVGYLLASQGKWGQAAPIYREVLEKRRRVLGDDHPHTLFSINNMGALLQTQRKFDEAEKLYSEALEKRRRLLGDDHPDTLQSTNNMGNLLEAQRKYTEAEPYYREALEKRLRVLGDEHPNTLNSISNMGTLLQSLGRLSEAEPYTREALLKRRRLLGNDHPDTLISINNMGVLLDKLGKLEEPEPYYREALERGRRVSGGEDSNSFNTMMSLSSLLESRGEHAEAVELMAAAEPTARRKFAAGGHWQLGLFLTALGRARAAAGEFDAAEANLSEAQVILSEDDGATAQDRMEVLSCLVKLYEVRHSAEPDRAYDAKAAEWRAKLAEWQAIQEQLGTSSQQPALPGN